MTLTYRFFDELCLWHVSRPALTLLVGAFNRLPPPVTNHRKPRLALCLTGPVSDPPGLQSAKRAPLASDEDLLRASGALSERLAASELDAGGGTARGRAGRLAYDGLASPSSGLSPRWTWCHGEADNATAVAAARVTGLCRTRRFSFFPPTSLGGLTEAACQAKARTASSGSRYILGTYAANRRSIPATSLARRIETSASGRLLPRPATAALKMIGEDRSVNLNAVVSAAQYWMPGMVSWRRNVSGC